MTLAWVWLSKRGALGGVSAYAFQGSQRSSRESSVARGSTGGDAAGGSVEDESRSGSAKLGVDRRSGGREGGTSEEGRSEGVMKFCFGSPSRMDVRLDKVAFLRMKPAIASYVGVF